MSDRIVDTDARGRASLGRPGCRDVMHEESDGTLVLEPAAVVTELERRFLANNALQAQIAHAWSRPEQRVKRQRRTS